MVITNAQYKNNHYWELTAVEATIDGEPLVVVPIDTANRHYAEILKQVADGDITIAEAD